jgi:hypothetical protein
MAPDLEGLAATMADGFLGILRCQSLQIGLGNLRHYEDRSGAAESGCQLCP